jgi:hypothetical protein
MYFYRQYLVALKILPRRAAAATYCHIVPSGFLVRYEYTVAKEAERSVGLDMAHVCLRAESRASLSANQLNMAVLRYD